jgi:hypothetical protein
MEKCSILLIEPEGGPVQQAHLPWPSNEIRIHNDPKKGIADAIRLRPQVVVLSLRQPKANGLRIARALRNHVGSRPFIIVYGELTRSELRVYSTHRRLMRRKWGVDRILPGAPSGSYLREVVEKLEHQRMRRDGTMQRPDQAASIEPSPAPRTAVTEDVDSPHACSTALQYAMLEAARSVSPRRQVAEPQSSTGLFTRLRGMFSQPDA